MVVGDVLYRLNRHHSSHRVKRRRLAHPGVACKLLLNRNTSLVLVLSAASMRRDGVYKVEAHRVPVASARIDRGIIILTYQIKRGIDKELVYTLGLCSILEGRYLWQVPDSFIGSLPVDARCNAK